MNTFQTMEVFDVQHVCISRSTLFHLLQVCIKHKNLALGREVSDIITRRGFDTNTFFGTHLIRMFASCGSLSEADVLFRKLSNPSIYTWEAIISAHSKLGHYERSIHLYHELINTNMKPNEYIHVSVLKACANLTDLTGGNLIFLYIVEDELENDPFIGNTMMDIYVKCGCLEDAHKVFRGLGHRDAVSWNVLILGYAMHGHGLEAVELLQQMQHEGMCPDGVTYATVVKACSSISDVERGMLIHHSIIESGVEGDAHIFNVLIHMYMTCGNFEDANTIFENLVRRDVVAWSTMISGYVNQGHCSKALKTFEKMQGEGLKPNNVTYPSILNACANSGLLDEGKLVHFHVVECDYATDIYIGSALIDMYAKCGTLEDALAVFEHFTVPNEITWNSMIAAYVHADQGEEALDLFQRFLFSGFKPDRVVYLSALKACSNIVALDWGRLLHNQIIRCGFVAELSVGNALIDMYSRCGSLADACSVFEEMPNQGIITWSTLIAAYAHHNDHPSVFECFEKMRKTGIKPNSIIFVSLLSACSQKGLIDKGYDYFFSMKADYGVKATAEHYNCIVDLLSRGGHMDEAEHLLASMPFKDKFLGWKSLLSHCKLYNQVKRARRCFDQLFAIDPKDASIYALMMGIYSNANMWKEVYEIRDLRNQAGVHRKFGKAIIQIGNTFHSFVAGNVNEKQSEMIYDRLKAACTRSVDETLSEKLVNLLTSVLKIYKDDVLCGHSELLAIGLGLLSTQERTTLRISKNLRMCGECHAITKFICKFEKREIMVMDTFCVHHFKNGLCCCNE